jgi:hypothetical protein
MKSVGVVGPIGKNDMDKAIPNRGTKTQKSGSTMHSGFSVDQKHRTDMMKKPMMHKSLKGTGCC